MSALLDRLRANEADAHREREIQRNHRVTFMPKGKPTRGYSAVAQGDRHQKRREVQQMHDFHNGPSALPRKADEFAQFHNKDGSAKVDKGVTQADGSYLSRPALRKRAKTPARGGWAGNTKRTPAAPKESAAGKTINPGSYNPFKSYLKR